MQRSKQIKTNSPSFNLRLIYPLFIPLCLCSYQNKQIENHPNGILPSPNLWNTRLYIFQKGCSSQRVWNILKRSAKETQTDCGHLDWFLLGSVIFCIFWSCSCCSDMEFVKCLHQWDFRNFQFYPRPILFEQVPFATNTLSAAALWIFRSKLNNTTFFWHHRILCSISFQLQKESLHWKEKCQLNVIE